MALVLLCRVAARRCAITIEHVTETLRPLVTTPVLGASAAVLGASIYRGAPIPVLDAGVVLGGDRLAAPTRWIVLRLGIRRAALAVDDVLGVREVDGSHWRALDPLLQGATDDANAPAIAALGTLDAELLVVLAAARLVPAMLWDLLEHAA